MGQSKMDRLKDFKFYTLCNFGAYAFLDDMMIMAMHICVCVCVCVLQLRLLIGVRVLLHLLTSSLRLVFLLFVNYFYSVFFFSVCLSIPGQFNI